MHEILEDKLTCRRRIETRIKNIEENEYKAIEAIRQKRRSTTTSIGPANDLLRFLYILEQQNKNDTDEIRARTRQTVLEHIHQYRQPDNVDEDNEEDEHSQEAPTKPPDKTVDIPPALPIQPTPAAPVPIAPSPLAAVPSPASQPVSQLSSQPAPLDAAFFDPNCIKPETRIKYESLRAEAWKFEECYEKVDIQRKKKLASRIKDIMNKLRKDTFKTLTHELFEFLTGREQQVGSQTIRITSRDERLACLSILATSILAQLLGGDLTDIKEEVFLPLVAALSENPHNQEFTTIFRERLQRKCPYTIPYYPKREETMTDRQYLEKLGYIEKQDGDQRRLETETEFLNRMSGLIRLFCKLLVRRGPPFDKNLGFAWTWFSDVLNLKPRPNITALLLRVFLDEAGKDMIREYPTQFPKLITYIQTRHLPDIERETSHDQISRLRMTLETVTKKS